jgi:hypothetical protein
MHIADQTRTIHLGGNAPVTAAPPVASAGGAIKSTRTTSESIVLESYGILERSKSYYPMFTARKILSGGRMRGDKKEGAEMWFVRLILFIAIVAD